MLTSKENSCSFHLPEQSTPCTPRLFTTFEHPPREIGEFLRNTPEIPNGDLMFNVRIETSVYTPDHFRYTALQIDTSTVIHPIDAESIPRYLTAINVPTIITRSELPRKFPIPLTSMQNPVSKLANNQTTSVNTLDRDPRLPAT